MTVVQRVLFVCEGNICRSPFAAAVFAQAWTLATGTPPEVTSGGTRAPLGRPSHEQLRAVADDEGERAFLDAHRSQRVTAALLGRYDLVVTMERRHRSALMDIDPRALRKVFTLGELAALEDVLAALGPNAETVAGRPLAEVVGEHRLAILDAARDVADPVVGGAEEFAAMAGQVRPAVLRLVALLRRWHNAERTDRTESTGSTDRTESTGSTDRTESTGSTDRTESTGSTGSTERTGSTGS